jgi:hypothetical protein
MFKLSLKGIFNFIFIFSFTEFLLIAFNLININIKNKINYLHSAILPYFGAAIS